MKTLFQRIVCKNIKSRRQAALNHSIQTSFFEADERIAYLKDEQYRYIYVNKSFENFHNVCAVNVAGLTDHEIFDSEFAEECRRTDTAAITQMRVMTDHVQWKHCLFRTIKFPVPLEGGRTGVGALVSDITDMEHNNKQLEKTLHRNMILVDVMKKDFSTTQQQLDYVLNEATKLTESQFGYIYLYSEDQEVFLLNSWSRDVMPACRVVQKDSLYYFDKTGIWGEVVRQRKPIIVNDFDKPNPLKKGFPEGHVRLKRFMSVPVFRNGKIVAVAGVANKPEEYKDSDVEQLSALTSGVWTAKERRDAQVQLYFERNKYLQTLISIGDGVLFVDKFGCVEMLNKVAETLTGWTMEQALGKHCREVFILSHEMPGRTIEDPIEKTIMTNTRQELEDHAVLTSKDGTRFLIEDSSSPLQDSDGHLEGVVLVFRDVTEKREQHNKIEYLSYHDSLTGLYNRRYFEKALTRLDIPEKLPLTIMMGDVNGLKLANDIFGHRFSDLLLIRAADTLRSICRQSDIAARWGGDEFIMLLPETTEESAEQLIAAIQDAFTKQQIKSIRGALSLGYSAKQLYDQNVYSVMEVAENNMYTQKTLQQGREKSQLTQTIVDMFHDSYPDEEVHSARVCELSLQIGQALALPDAEMLRLKEAALLHDIGKIAIGAELFNRKGEYCESEIQIIRQHPATGYRLLSYFDKTLELAGIVLAHHENWDGSGHPKGLKGEQIPFLARIIAAAEGYQQTQDRFPNDQVTGRQKASGHIRTYSGSLYYPRVVNALIEAVNS